jgi:hypothetical protein
MLVAATGVGEGSPVLHINPSLQNTVFKRSILHALERFDARAISVDWTWGIEERSFEVT